MQLITSTEAEDLGLANASGCAEMALLELHVRSSDKPASHFQLLEGSGFSDV